MAATVIYDGDCGLCTRMKEIAEALDWLGTMRWIPQQNPAAARYRIPVEQFRNAVFIVSSAGTAQGWSAVKRIVARLPLTYVISALAMRKSPWTAAGLALLFSPPLNPAGDRAYAWVARNRYRIPGSTCAIPVWDNRTK